MESTTPNELIVFMDDNKIEADLRATLIEKFQPFFDQANEWKNKAEALVIKSVDQTDDMKAARVARLALVKVRTDLEKMRKKLNEDDKARIEARNGIAKVLTAIITPTEAHLEEQENFIETETARINKELKEHRITLLKPYGEIPEYYDLATMPQELFNTLLEDTALLFHAKEDQKKKADEAKQLEKQIADRHAELINLGFATDQYGDYIHPVGLNVPADNLKKASDVWGDLIKHLDEEIKRINKEAQDAEAEIQRKTHEVSMRVLSFQRLGFYPFIPDGHDGPPTIYKNEKYGYEINASMLDASKEDFNKLVAEVIEKKANKDAIDRKRKAEEDAAAEVERKKVQAIKDGIINERKQTLISLGFVEGKNNTMSFSTYGVSLPNIAELDSENWVNNLHAITEAVKQIKIKLKQDQDKKEADEKAERDAAMSDKEKIISFYKKIVQLEGEIKTTEFKANKNIKNFSIVKDTINGLSERLKDAYTYL